MRQKRVGRLVKKSERRCGEVERAGPRSSKLSLAGLKKYTSEFQSFFKEVVGNVAKGGA